VGDEFTTKDIRVLRSVLLVALLDGNPSDIAGDDTLNAGHQIWTSDNVAIVGHRIGPDGFIATQSGAMAQAWVGGLQIGDERSAIPPPIEVPSPSSVGHLTRSTVTPFGTC
jgi:hypothetical protein